MITFSIITINLNNSTGLKKTIDSVLVQSYINYEFIIIDGASADGSVDEIKKYNQSIAFWVSEKDQGIYSAMNKGVFHSRGDYLLFLNSGDILVDSDVLKNVAASHPIEDLLYGDMLIIEENGLTREGKMPDNPGILHLLKDTLWHPVTFFSRKAFLDFGQYDESFKIAGDYDAILFLLIKRKSSYRHLPFVISVFTNNGLSAKSENRKLIDKERLIIQKRYFNPLLLSLFRFYRFIRN